MTQAGSTYGSLIKGALEAWPDRIAFRGDGQAITYRDLGRRISQFAQVLAMLGVGDGDGVAILSPNRPEYFMLTVACALMGVRYTPLHPLGSEDDHRQVLDDAQISVLVADAAAFGARAAALQAALPGLRTRLMFGGDDAAADLLALADLLPAAPLEDLATADHIAAVPYTGGTTGLPKGVVLTHRCVTSYIAVALAEWEWPPEVTALLTTPVSHAAGGIIPLVLLQGGTVILQPGFKADRLLDTIEAERATVLFLVPTMIYMLLDELARRPRDTSSLGLVIYGAAPMSPDRLAEALERMGPVFMQVYGQVEASPTICALKTADHLQPGRLSSCGKVLAGHELALMDEAGREVDGDEAGEICLRSPAIMREYWRRPAETAAAFRDGWLRTGDIARRDADGFLHIVDRAKDMIISGGFNVYPREIEDVLMSHPAVARAAVIGVPDAKWGEAVDAYVVARPGGADPAELTELVRARKGTVHAPKRVTLVDELPLTPIGKVDKKALRALFWSHRERQVS